MFDFIERIVGEVPATSDRLVTLDSGELEDEVKHEFYPKHQTHPELIMKNEFFTVIPQNMREYKMSVREADLENDLFRIAFDEACAEDKPVDAKEMLFAWDFFKYGWEAAVRLLNDDVEREAFLSRLSAAGVNVEELTKVPVAPQKAVNSMPNGQ